MVGTFKANIPYNNFLLFVYGFLLYLPAFIRPVAPVISDTDALLYHTLMGWVAYAGKSFHFLYTLPAYLLVYFQAVALNSIVNNQRLLPKPNYLTGMSYLLIAALFPGWYGLHAPLVSLTPLIWILSRLSNLQNNPHTKSTLYNIGLMMGISTFIYFPSVIFVLLIFVGITITRPFRLPEWVVALMGMLTPYYLLFSYDYIFDIPHPVLSDYLLIGRPVFFSTRAEFVALIILLVIFFMGAFWVQNNIRRMLVQSRKTWVIINVFLLLTVLSPFLIEKSGIHCWMLVVVPFAGYSASAFLFPSKKWIPLTLHWSLVALVAYMGYLHVVH